MSQIIRKVSAAVILIMLIIVPFLNFQLGAVLWMCAWLIFIFQNLHKGQWKLGERKDREDDQE
jgi:hypothetical protein